jgi:hypothetical protein
MSLEELMEPQDTPVTVGVLSRADRQLDAPVYAVYAVDFGEEYPAIDGLMRRYKKIALDMQPSLNGYMYYVTSDKIIMELTSEAIDRALAAPPEDMLSELCCEGRPEFSSCFEVSRETDARFCEARTACGGKWLLLIFTCAVTEVMLDADGTVYSIASRKRSDYSFFES